jgi:hypothetical protein
MKAIDKFAVTEWLIDHGPNGWRFTTKTGRLFHAIIFLPASFLWAPLIILSALAGVFILLWNYVQTGEFE